MSIRPHFSNGIGLNKVVLFAVLSASFVSNDFFCKSTLFNTKIKCQAFDIYRNEQLLRVARCKEKHGCKRIEEQADFSGTYSIALHPAVHDLFFLVHFLVSVHSFHHQMFSTMFKFLIDTNIFCCQPFPLFKHTEQ